MEIGIREYSGGCATGIAYERSAYQSLATRSGLPGKFVQCKIGIWTAATNPSPSPGRPSFAIADNLHMTGMGEDIENILQE